MNTAEYQIFSYECKKDISIERKNRKRKFYNQISPISCSDYIPDFDAEIFEPSPVKKF